MLANYPIYIIVIIIYCMYRLYWYTFQVIQVYDLDRYQDMQLAAGSMLFWGCRDWNFSRQSEDSWVQSHCLSLRYHLHSPGRYPGPFTNSFWRNFFLCGGLGKSTFPGYVHKIIVCVCGGGQHVEYCWIDHLQLSFFVIKSISRMRHNHRIQIHTDWYRIDSESMNVKTPHDWLNFLKFHWIDFHDNQTNPGFIFINPAWPLDIQMPPKVWCFCSVYFGASNELLPQFRWDWMSRYESIIHHRWWLLSRPKNQQILQVLVKGGR